MFVAILILTASFVCFYSQANVCQSDPLYDFYPNVTNRSSFIRCEGYDGNYTSLNCPDGFAFKARTSKDDNTPLCVSKFSQYGQASFDCSNQNGNGSYSEDKTLYASCKNGTPQELYQCPLGLYFLDSIQKCELSCGVRYKIGSFPLADGTKFYTCNFDYGTLKWILTVGSCPTDTSFDPTYQACL